jgi:hypothetical protein
MHRLKNNIYPAEYLIITLFELTPEALLIDFIQYRDAV